MSIKQPVMHWRGFKAPASVTPIVSHPDDVWQHTGDNEYAVARGWKLLRVTEDGTPVKMIGCEGGCGGTAPDWHFEEDVVFVDGPMGFKVVYTCKSCGGNGTEESYNFSEDLYCDFNAASKRYQEAMAEAKQAMATMTEIADRLNDDWNKTFTVEDYIV